MIRDQHKSPQVEMEKEEASGNMTGLLTEECPVPSSVPSPSSRASGGELPCGMRHLTELLPSSKSVVEGAWRGTEKHDYLAFLMALVWSASSRAVVMDLIST